MAELENPYQPPTARVDDAGSERRDSGSYIEGGRAVESSRGWAWIREGFQFFRRQAGMWLVLAFIFFALVFGLQFIPFVGQLLLPLFMPVLVGGLMTGCEAIRRGRELELAHLFAGFRSNLGQLVLVGAIGVVLSIVVVIPMMLFSGLAALVAATVGASSLLALGSGGLIALGVSVGLLVLVNMAILFAPALVVLEDQSAARAIGQSFRGCIKNIVPFLLYGVIVLVLAIVATAPLALGWLVLLPVGLCSIYSAYRDIFVQP